MTKTQKKKQEINTVKKKVFCHFISSKELTIALL
jgi:hypothetical protein